VSAPPVTFRFDVRLKGRSLVVVRGVRSASGGCDVETETRPVDHSPDEPPLQRTFTFATYEMARRFTDELLTTLEYQSCDVNTLV
jgi:hypothetical protein